MELERFMYFTIKSLKSLLKNEGYSIFFDYGLSSLTYSVLKKFEMNVYLKQKKNTFSKNYMDGISYLERYEKYVKTKMVCKTYIKTRSYLIFKHKGFQKLFR